MSDSIMDDAEVMQPHDPSLDALGARIKVIGVGGGGGNAVQHMIEFGLPGVEFICANTDKQALNKSTAEHKIQIGEKLTGGRGAGANPKVGREAAMESINAIRDSIGDAEMLFVTAGMGGGTGTGASAVVAQVAREMNVLTVGVVTKPFTFEGTKRKKAAEDGLAELKQYVDCLIMIPNDRLIGLAPKKATFLDMLQKSNEVLYHAVKGISDVVNAEGLINLDFADVRTTMQEAGLALMGTGVGTGENRARDAAQKAISSPLLEDVSLDSAKAILYNITAPRDVGVNEINEIGTMIQEASPEECNIIFGVVYSDQVGDDLSVTLIATGIEPTEEVEPLPSTKLIQKKLVTPKISPQIASLNIRPEDEQEQIPVQPRTTSRRRRSQPSAEELQPRFSGESDSMEFAFDEPTERLGVGRRASSGLRRSQVHAPGKDTYAYEEGSIESLDIPSFIRHQAN